MRKSRWFTCLVNSASLQTQLAIPGSFKPFPSGAPDTWSGLRDPPNSSMTSVQITSVSKSKFPLDQCRSRITAFWRLAQPRFPNGPNLEGLFFDPPSQSPPPPPLNRPAAQKHTQTHTFPNQVDWIIDVYLSDAFVKLHKSDRNCQSVCVCASVFVIFRASSKIPHSLIITENMYCPLQHSS